MKKIYIFFVFFALSNHLYMKGISGRFSEIIRKDKTNEKNINDNRIACGTEHLFMR